MSAISLPYLGKPGAMRVLPTPTGPVAATPDKSDVVKSLLSGGVAVLTQLQARRTFSLPFEFLDATSADLLLGFYHRLFGNGPFVYVDPSVRNVLGLDVSTCGLRTNAPPEWVASTGTLTPAATGGPTGITTGVLAWTTLANGATLQPGLVANTAIITKAPVYLPTEAVTVSLWAKASASHTATLQLTGYDAAGAPNYTSSTASMALTTAWQRFSVSVAAGLGGLASSMFVLPRVVLGTTPPTSVSVAGAQVEYGTAVTAFQAGFGSPRVLPTATPGRDWQQAVDISTNHTLVLREVA